MKFAFKKIYYYVPPCPKCGSRKTGRYIKRPFSGAGSVKGDALKNGELIRFLNEEPYNNCFCMTCGHEWHKYIGISWKTSEEIREEQKARGTSALYEEYLAATSKTTTQKVGIFGGLFGRSTEERQTYVADPYPEPEAEESEFAIVDSRPQDVLEIIYTDKELIQKTLEVRS